MDVATIINLSRKQTWTSAGQISDSDYLNYLNITYKDVFNRLSVNSRKYTWQSYLTDIVAWQAEYILPNPVSDEWNGGLKLVLNVFYKQEKIPLYDTSLYDSNKDLFDKNKKPYWILRDGSIFIIPIPDKDIEAWLYIEWKYVPVDLELTSTNDDIKLSPEYHNILVKGLNSLVFGEKQVFDKQQLWEQYFEQAIHQMQVEWCFENESAYHVEDAYLWFLE